MPQFVSDYTFINTACAAVFPAGARPRRIRSAAAALPLGALVALEAWVKRP